MLFWLVIFIGAVGVFGAIHSNKMKKLEHQNRLTKIQRKIRQKENKQ